MKKTLVVLLVLAPLFAASAQEGSTAGDGAPSASSSSASWFGNGLNDAGTHSRPNQLSLMADLGYGYGFGLGVGARYGITVLPDGFLPQNNDSLMVEFGADLNAYFGYAFFGGGVWVTIPIAVGLRWNLFFTPEVAGFVHVEGGITVNPQGFGLGAGSIWGYYSFTLGVLYKLGNGMCLRAEVGYPFLKVGIAL